MLVCARVEAHFLVVFLFLLTLWPYSGALYVLSVIAPPPLSFLLPQFFLIYYAAGRGAPGKHARDPVGESVFYVRHRDRHVQ